MPFEIKICAAWQCVWCQREFAAPKIRCSACGCCQYCGFLIDNNHGCRFCGNRLDNNLEEFYGALKLRHLGGSKPAESINGVSFATGPANGRRTAQGLP